MQHDPRGTAITTPSAVAARELEAAVIALLGQKAEGGARLAAALAADPMLVAGHAMAGFAQMMSARRPIMAEAPRSLARARDALEARGGTPRERALTQALAAWAEGGDMERAAAGLEAIAQQDPRDALALRLAHGIRFMLGDAPAMRAALEAALPRWDPALPGHAYMQGCLAFALEETGEPEAAETLGRRAVAAEPGDLWGAHAVAHALGAQGRMREGLAWLRWLEPHLAGGSNFVRHVHWHRALFHLALGQEDAALALHDAKVWAEPSEDVRDLMNAASLLWRLEAAGVAVGARRWQGLADIAEARAADRAWAFADLHHVLCLAAAGRREALARMLAGLARHAGSEADSQARVLAAVGLAAARGVAAAVAGEAAEGARLLDAAIPRLHAAGGSHAQRELFVAMRDQAAERARAAGRQRG
ncbi:tetratricopeptide repeat protein [Roseomonas sp. HF4]|uniref:tetratricopeptide repeat protein n=1 Tax=Roseomonas sp. HF4 TaxID=2562313 RepID=UPI0010BF851E|nr:tetratricopeptide repeat protein [Roseomonas sp. HF4]